MRCFELYRCGPLQLDNLNRSLDTAEVNYGIITYYSSPNHSLYTIYLGSYSNSVHRWKANNRWNGCCREARRNTKGKLG